MFVVQFVSLTKPCLYNASYGCSFDLVASPIGNIPYYCDYLAWMCKFSNLNSVWKKHLRPL